MTLTFDLELYSQNEPAKQNIYVKSYYSTTICCLSLDGLNYAQPKSTILRPANSHHRHGFLWLLLRCSCIVEWLAFSTPWPGFVTHWFQTDAENCFRFTDGLCFWH